MSYAITFSITALCPCCGKELPSNSYLTESKPTGHPLERDNPYERKDRRVFITPCAVCFRPKQTNDPADDTELLRRALHYLEAEQIARYGRKVLEEVVAAGYHPVVADLRKRLAADPVAPSGAGAAMGGDADQNKEQPK